MREIKFRAWDGKQMIILPLAGLQYFDFEGSYALSFVVDGYSGFWAHEQYETPSKKASSFPIMQFTGLKDKNGTEIYEGDITQGESKRDGVFKSIIKFERCGFRPFQIGFDYTYCPSPLSEDTINVFRVEVIGNIYENPELIAAQ